MEVNAVITWKMLGPLLLRQGGCLFWDVTVSVSLRIASGIMLTVSRILQMWLSSDRLEGYGNVEIPQEIYNLKLTWQNRQGTQLETQNSAWKQFCCKNKTIFLDPHNHKRSVDRYGACVLGVFKWI